MRINAEGRNPTNNANEKGNKITELVYRRIGGGKPRLSQRRIERDVLKGPIVGGC